MVERGVGKSFLPTSNMACTSPRFWPQSHQRQLAIGEAPRSKPPLRSPLRSPNRPPSALGQRRQTPRARTPGRAKEKRAADRSQSPLTTYLKRKQIKQEEQEEKDKETFPDLGRMVPWPAKPVAKKRPRPAPRAQEEEGGGGDEQELSQLRRRQAHLQQSVAAALAVKFAIPLPAAESATREVEQAMRDAMTTTTT